ncbi:DNA polymerase [Methanohalophilus halophilus]|uniref:DNA-directed DNA polymerase n=1 Tax=Methanohalophilus halophilus TaxID=2177 RepID=A0A1L3Q0E6_9EURY|nr:DNA polymerase [Methanohalophilus halophilus]APH38231.1 hypothetical protein BHR79_01180 [Methanohalophilus halophilus]RNI10902.1 hypothetical protein EFE40_01610 [Methanohalophilus halophilus]SDV99880.1 DNA polymerase type B [Methanohalophilus halophilus]
MTKVAVRGYTHKEKKAWKGETPTTPLRHDRVLVFDTETTTDQYQNMKIGYFQIYQDGYIQHEGLFYDPSMLDVRETRALNIYASRHTISIYTLSDFVDNVFYTEVYDFQTLCVGFNLAFDISRIAKRSGNSRGKNKGGFTLTLSDDRVKPPIVIKKLGTAYSFKFTTTKQNKGKEYFGGYFLDAQKLAEVLLQSKNHISLDKVGERLNTNIKKKKNIKHGRVTEKYIDYLVTDVKTTFEVYRELVKELDLYGIDIPITRVFSAASLGKHAMKQIGINPFLEKNPDFSPEMLGNIMTAYFGGRCECKIRKTPTQVTVLDFTSMYPTITLMLDLWPFLIADRIETEDATEEAKKILSNIDLDYLQNPDNWPHFNILVKLKPDEDILPVRMDYKGKNESYNVGLNHVSSKDGLWYALPDVIGSVLLTGKTPEIIEAVKFVPVGIQDDLNIQEILGINIDPSKESLTKIMVEERQKIKQDMKSLDKKDPEYQHLKSRAQAIKILVNAMSYGIFIELNPEDKKSDIQVYGLDDFSTSENRFEKPGNFYHPFVAVMITAGSRLFLAMAEARLKELGGTHAYMDTDSIFVPPENAQEIVDYFQPLNPYALDIPLLKPEKEDMWFYGISSKRYALYNLNKDKIEFMEGERSYKLHGLGHLTNPFPKDVEDWQAEIWQDILKLHYGIISEEDIVEKYSSLYAISQLTVSTSNVLDRFKDLNAVKEWREQIKPFNFFLVGFQTTEENDKVVKPLAPFTKDYQKIVYESFIDYQTGEVRQGSYYFKPLSNTILEYIDHPEHKFGGDTGTLARKHIDIDGFVYIGKEANDIDEQELDVVRPQKFIDGKAVEKFILGLTPEDARRIGIKHRSALAYLKKKAKEGELNFKSRNMERIMDAFM